jgi:DNA-binding transcriptional LysR family regulator
MDQFAALKTFASVASTGGFSSAARQLGVVTSSVTRLIDALEQKIGAPLLNRSTRSVTLTDIGRVYYERAVRILADLEEADETASARNSEPRGLLRLTAPVTFASLYIAPLLGDLRLRYPSLELDMRLSDSVSNLVDESIDLAIRIGTIEDHPNLIARKLAEHERYICASPAYLERHGTPLTPTDLASHNCLQFFYQTGRQIWRLQTDAGIDEMQVRGSLSVNNSDVLRQAVLRDVGLALLPDWLVRHDIATGKLLRVLPQYQVNPSSMNVGIYALYPANRRGSSKVKAVIEVLMSALGTSVTQENKKPHDAT